MTVLGQALSPFFSPASPGNGTGLYESQLSLLEDPNKKQPEPQVNPEELFWDRYYRTFEGKGYDEVILEEKRRKEIRVKYEGYLQEFGDILSEVRKTGKCRRKTLIIEREKGGVRHKQGIIYNCHSVFCPHCRKRLDQAVFKRYRWWFEGEREITFFTLTISREKYISLAFAKAYSAIQKLGEKRISKRKLRSWRENLVIILESYLKNKEKRVVEKNKNFDREGEIERLTRMFDEFSQEVERKMVEAERTSLKFRELGCYLIGREETFNGEGIHIHWHGMTNYKIPFFILNLLWKEVLESVEGEVRGDTITDIRKVPVEKGFRYLEKYVSKNNPFNDLVADSQGRINLNALATSQTVLSDENEIEKAVSIFKRTEQTLTLLKEYYQAVYKRKRWIIWGPDIRDIRGEGEPEKINLKAELGEVIAVYEGYFVDEELFSYRDEREVREGKKFVRVAWKEGENTRRGIMRWNDELKIFEIVEDLLELEIENREIGQEIPF